MTYFSNTLLWILFSKMHTKRIGIQQKNIVYRLQSVKRGREREKGEGMYRYLVIRDLALLIIFF